MLSDMPFLGERMCIGDYEHFLAERVNKVILVYNDREIPFWFRALSSRFKEHLAFGYIHFDEEIKLVRKRLKLAGPPVLIAILDSGERLTYTGNLSFESVEKWALSFAHPERRRVHYRKPHSAHERIHNFSEVNKSDETYEEKLEKFHGKARRLHEHNQKVIREAEEARRLQQQDL
jgi:hypothetical protein